MPATFVDPIDIEKLPEQLWLRRFNRDEALDEAAQKVNTYLPIPRFDSAASNTISTTAIAAYYPPPVSEAYKRRHKDGRPKLRSRDDYINGLKDMILACRYLIVFVPPGQVAEELRTLSVGKHVLVIDKYQTLWDLPHLGSKKESFYSRQIKLHESLGPRGTKTGEPHSWAAWNAKTYFWLEAMKLDPFQTSHFVWLDARTPRMARIAFPDDETLVAGTWPHPEAVRSMYRSMKSNTRTVVILSYDHALSPPDKKFWPTLRPGVKAIKAGIDDVIGIGASLFFGDKASLSRFARAHLVLFERDFARDFYVAREELQMSYAFWEYAGLYHALELFRRLPLEMPMKIGFYAYMLLGNPEADWAGLGLEKEPERLLEWHAKILYKLQTFLLVKRGLVKSSGTKVIQKLRHVQSSSPPLEEVAAADRYRP